MLSSVSIFFLWTWSITWNCAKTFHIHLNPRLGSIHPCLNLAYTLHVGVCPAKQGLTLVRLNQRLPVHRSWNWNRESLLNVFFYPGFKNISPIYCHKKIKYSFYVSMVLLDYCKENNFEFVSLHSVDKVNWSLGFIQWNIFKILQTLYLGTISSLLCLF